jgi:hypothetical protein
MDGRLFVRWLFLLLFLIVFRLRFMPCSLPPKFSTSGVFVAAALVEVFLHPVVIHCIRVAIRAPNVTGDISVIFPLFFVSSLPSLFVVVTHLFPSPLGVSAGLVVAS